MESADLGGLTNCTEEYWCYTPVVNKYQGNLCFHKYIFKLFIKRATVGHWKAARKRKKWRQCTIPRRRFCLRYYVQI